MPSWQAEPGPGSGGFLKGSQPGNPQVTAFPRLRPRARAAGGARSQRLRASMRHLNFCVAPDPQSLRGYINRATGRGRTTNCGACWASPLLRRRTHTTCRCSLSAVIVDCSDQPRLRAPGSSAEGGDGPSVSLARRSLSSRQDFGAHPDAINPNSCFVPWGCVRWAHSVWRDSLGRVLPLFCQ